jgi:hypothetical protein
MSRKPAWLVKSLLLSAVFLAYSAIAIASTLDRLSLDSPALEKFVPGLLRAQADRARAILALTDGRGAASVDAAVRAVQSDPVHPDSTALLGLALGLSGDAAGAERAFHVASGFGWRNMPTQIYWYEAGIARGEARVAVDRADAILRQHPTFPSARKMLGRLDSDSNTRAALIDRLGQKPPWLPLYFNLALQGDQPARSRRAEVVEGIARSGYPLGCKVVFDYTLGLVGVGQPGMARRIWNAHCPNARVAAGLSDPDFDRLDSERVTPFDWSVRRSGDVSVELEKQLPGQNTVLVLHNRSLAGRLVLVQPLALLPGRYRLSGAVRANGAAASGRIIAAHYCSQSMPFPSAIDGDIAHGGQTIVVPACDQQWLGLWVLPGDTALSLDRLVLEEYPRWSSSS